MTTQSSTGFTGSDTSACNGWLCSGRRTPAIAATTELCPAATIATFSASIAPRLVSTPTTRPPAVRIPVTSQFSTMSTPRASAARAKPQATASWRATPPRRCSVAPSTG